MNAKRQRTLEEYSPPQGEELAPSWEQLMELYPATLPTWEEATPVYPAAEEESALAGLASPVYLADLTTFQDVGILPDLPATPIQIVTVRNQVATDARDSSPPALSQGLRGSKKSL